MFQEYDVVKLKHTLSASTANAWSTDTTANLAAGTIGAVVMVYPGNGSMNAYEVEFTNEEGQTLALVQLNEDELELVQSAS